jgi:hypothetical protein
MAPLSNSSRLKVAAGLLACCLLSLWLMGVPDTLTPSTYAMVATLLIALTSVAIMTFRNGQATGSIGQLIYETNVAQTTSALDATRVANQKRSER